MKLIIGLGNPGEKYEKTRHNLGFMVLEQFLKNYEPVEKTEWKIEEKIKSEIAQIYWSGEKIILAKPQTYMNNSGLAVKLAISYWQLAISDVWVMHDDIDLLLGKIKIRLGGGSAGHRGIESIIKNLGTDKFVRFRLGIGRESLRLGGKSLKLKNTDDFVLGEFTGSERGKARKLIKKGATAVESALERGLDAAMNRFNAK